MGDAQARRRTLGIDAAVASGLVALSVLPYLFDVGFYSDDWFMLSDLAFADQRSILGLWTHQMEVNDNLALRPTQALQAAILFRFFGTDPLGYHVVNAAVLILLGGSLHVLARRLGAPRYVAFPFAVLAVVLPSAATNRFWFASSFYSLSVLLAVWSALAQLAVLRASGARVVVWKLLALLLLLAAGMGAEVVVPALAVLPLGLWLIGRRRWDGGLVERFGRVGTTALLGSDYVVLAAIAWHKSRFETRGALDLLTLGEVYIRGPLIDFGVHGVLNPVGAAWAATRVGVAGAVIAVGLGVVFALYLRRLLPDGEGRAAAGSGDWLARRSWAGMILLGLLLYALGYAIFIVSSRVDVSLTGAANRAAAFSVLGVALCAVAVAGLGASAVARRRGLFTAVVTTLVVGSVLTVAVIGRYYARSWDTQQEVLEGLAAERPTLPPDAAVILAGVCPYEGPAVVFESHWDFAGALQLLYDRRDLRADVVRDLRVEDEHLETRIYGDAVSYPYGDTLFVWDVADRTLVALPTHATALRVLGRQPTQPDCPEGRPGHGALVRPGDRFPDAIIDPVERRLRR